MTNHNIATSVKQPLSRVQVAGIQGWDFCPNGRRLQSWPRAASTAGDHSLCLLLESVRSCLAQPLIACVIHSLKYPFFFFFFLLAKTFWRIFSASYFCGFGWESLGGAVTLFWLYSLTLLPNAEALTRTFLWHVRFAISSALFIHHYVIQFCHISVSVSLTLSPGLGHVLSWHKWSRKIRCDTLKHNSTQRSNLTLQNKSIPIYLHYDSSSVPFAASFPVSCLHGCSQSVKVPEKKK